MELGSIVWSLCQVSLIVIRKCSFDRRKVHLEKVLIWLGKRGRTLDYEPTTPENRLKL